MLSTYVHSQLSNFPTVTPAELRLHDTRLQKQLRASTACNLDEWESLVKYIQRNLKLPVQHEPTYNDIDVPRYDTSEMSLHFSRLRHLTSVFRHLTRTSLWKFVVKFKKRRSRKRRGIVVGQDHFSLHQGLEMMQLMETTVV